MDPSILPNKRKIDFKHLFYIDNHIAPFIIPVFILAFGYMAYGSILSGEEAAIPSLIVGIIFVILCSGLEIYLLIPGIKYIMAVKKGEHLFAEVVYVAPTKYIQLLINKDGKEIEQAFYSSNAYLEKCDGYLIVPIFYYKNQIHIDWANLENYGKCVIAPEMAEKTISISKFDKEIAELAQKTAKETEDYTLLSQERQFRSYFKAITLPFIIALFASLFIIIPLNIIYINKLITNFHMEIGYFILAFADFIVGLSLYYLLPDFINFQMYKSAKNKGERIIASSKVYASVGIYKSATKRKISISSGTDENNIVLELSYIGPQSIEIKNSYSLPKSLFGDNLKRTTCLPAFYHKGKVFPDFEGIAICCKLIK